MKKKYTQQEIFDIFVRNISCFGYKALYYDDYKRDVMLFIKKHGNRKTINISQLGEERITISVRYSVYEESKQVIFPLDTDLNIIEINYIIKFIYRLLMFNLSIDEYNKYVNYMIRNLSKRPEMGRLFWK